MAKTGRGKTKGAAEAQAEAAKDQASRAATTVLIAQRTLQALLKADDDYKGRIDGLTGELREAIGNAVEKKHLHKGAYALLKKLHRMKSNEQLADLWTNLLAYMDMTGVMKRVDSVSTLPLDGEANAENEEGEETGDEDAGVVRPAFGATAARH